MRASWNYCSRTWVEYRSFRLDSAEVVVYLRGRFSESITAGIVLGLERRFHLGKSLQEPSRHTAKILPVLFSCIGRDDKIDEMSALSLSKVMRPRCIFPPVFESKIVPRCSILLSGTALPHSSRKQPVNPLRVICRCCSMVMPVPRDDCMATWPVPTRIGKPRPISAC